MTNSRGIFWFWDFNTIPIAHHVVLEEELATAAGLRYETIYWIE